MFMPFMRDTGAYMRQRGRHTSFPGDVAPDSAGLRADHLVTGTLIAAGHSSVPSDERWSTDGVTPLQSDMCSDGRMACPQYTARDHLKVAQYA
jgi:hypothetical protein